MLAGRPPFRRESDLALLWAHLNDPPPSLREHRPDLPEAVDTVMTRALAKEPVQRFGDCLTFAGALRAAIAAPGPPSADPWQAAGPPTRVVPARSRAVPDPPAPAAAAPAPPAAAAPPAPPTPVPPAPPWAAPVVHPPPP